MRTFNSECRRNKNFTGGTFKSRQLRNLASMIRAQADIPFVSFDGRPLGVNEVAYIDCGRGVLRSLLASMQAMMIYIRKERCTPQRATCTALPKAVETIKAMATFVGTNEETRQVLLTLLHDDDGNTASWRWRWQWRWQ